MSLGTFTTFDSDRCRWRFGNGDYSDACTADEYGQQRRRGWTNIVCNPDLKERAVLVAASEWTACEYELTVASPEVCGPYGP